MRFVDRILQPLCVGVEQMDVYGDGWSTIKWDALSWTVSNFLNAVVAALIRTKTLAAGVNHLAL